MRLGGNTVSNFRRLQQKARKRYQRKLKIQKATFSTICILTIIITLSMMFVWGMNDGPTLETVIISASGWLVFDTLFAYAIKNKWYMLYDDCAHVLAQDYTHVKTEPERQKDNWQGNCCWFALSIAVLLIHLISIVIILL